MDDKKKLKHWYVQMSDITLPKCKSCNVPLACCSPEYCGMVEDAAKRWMEPVPEKTNHPTLPYMGEKGCVVPPHLRPLCTIHVCENKLWTDIDFQNKYIRLRDKMSQLEYKLFGLE